MTPVDAEIDLHEYRPEEIRFKLLPFLDRGYAENWQQIRIIHGQGQGVIKRKVRSILEDLDYIATFRSAHHYEGGAGATVAKYRRE